MFWHWLVQQVFPVGALSGAPTYLDQLEQDPTYRNNTLRLQRLIPSASKEVAEVAHAHAKDYLALEDKRADSIISRGQGLLVSQAFLGALLSLGGAVSSRADVFRGWPLWIVSAIVCYIVVQTFLLTRCALISTGAIGYPRVSSSQLAELLTGTEEQAISGLALRSIMNYRRSALLNDWRFISLHAAQNSLRNTAISLGFLVLIVLYLFHHPAPPPSDMTAQIDRLRLSLHADSVNSDRRASDIKDELASAQGGLVGINATLRDIRSKLMATEPSSYSCIGWQYGGR